jgi:hypothetical protein
VLLLLFGLLRSGQIKLRMLDGYRDLKELKRQRVTSARPMMTLLNFPPLDRHGGIQFVPFSAGS